MTDVEILDFSAVTLNGAGGNTITTAATTGDTLVTTLTVANATAGWTIDDQTAGTQITTIIGGAGDDTLLAGAAVTTLSGGAGNDTLDASGAAAGVNIIGGAGVDAMTAAAAGGVFTFSAGDTGLALGSIDTIAGFVSGGTDTLAFGGPQVLPVTLTMQVLFLTLLRPWRQQILR
ncbi:hypothetical protein [Neopusillimonas aromaticivorans]|uniref:hypothetical protein n=1 Tax=Neopusillimonas aromaticivorans TaxID=2979868 RepID=UPI0025931B63|nr:hypothetical protein [Neopusillimonas aromaticivorans]WJJ94738.1 hypothetical protein N7E01_07510 [Neopusillimonas aromaticivorans]